MRIITTTEAAAECRTSASSISRAARRGKIGLRNRSGRLVGIPSSELPALRKLLRYKPGNPNWGRLSGKRESA